MRRLLLVLLVVCGGGMVLVCVGLRMRPPTPAQKLPVDEGEGARGAGYEFAKKLLKDHLRSPATAEYPWEEVETRELAAYTDRKGETARRWSVTGAVDGQNAFGAKVREKWEVVILLFEGQFVAVKATLGQEEVYRAKFYEE